MRQALTLLALVVAADAASAAGPVCALLDPEKVPRAAIMEAKLLADPATTWVERSNIDKVLKEQKLQAAFSPEGVADRAQLGKLLKADVLVMVRPVKGQQETAIEVVVSETAGGLRLLDWAVPVTKDADADVGALLIAVRAGIKKHGEQVKEVVALPAFTSNNLGYEFDHLRGAYAKLAEQAALSRPGVVVVELAEAEALAREIKLAAPNVTLKRPEPLYLLGEFRHEGRGAQTTITLKLRSTRDGRPVGASVEKTIAPDAAPAVLRDWVAGQLATVGNGPKPAADSTAEARQLADLSRSRQRLGDWAEALALIEASLLLEPRQPELNADTMLLLRLRIEQILGREPKNLGRLQQAAPLYCRGLEQMEVLIKSGAKLPRYEGLDGVRGGRLFHAAFPFPQRPLPYMPVFAERPDSPEVHEVIREIEQEQRATCRRLLPLVAKSGDAHEFAGFAGRSIGNATGAERFAERGRLLLEFRDHPAAVGAAQYLLYAAAYDLTLDDLRAYRQLLDTLEKDGNDGLKAAVKTARQRLPEVEKHMAKLSADAAERKRLADEGTRTPPTKISPPLRLTRDELAKAVDERLKDGPLRQVRLKMASPDDDGFLNQVQGVVAAGPGVDVFWATGYFLPLKKGETRPKPGFGSTKPGPTLLIMKEKGKLRRVWEKPGAPERFTSVCFDGRFVWAATQGKKQPPALFVLDPEAETVYEVTVEDGLPQPPAEQIRDPFRSDKLALVVTPLDSGRVCVAGGFGQAWVAVATFTPTTMKAKVKVIHEARELPRQGESRNDIWQNRQLAFTPSFAFTLRGNPKADAKTPSRFLIGRSVTGLSTNDNLPQIAMHPLLVDPDGAAVEVLQESLLLRPQAVIVSDGAILTGNEPFVTTNKIRLLRIDSSGGVREIAQLNITDRAGPLLCAASGNRLHFVVENRTPVLQPGGMKSPGSAWWCADLDGKNLRRAADNTLNVRSINQSSHYGPLAWCNLFPGSAICEVVPSDPKRK